MKKKLMMVAVLLGALTLGACVDDNESASVTNVRNAKAEQLKAAAEFSKAQAEAELIRANAYKAYQEADAEYRKAQAEAAQLANEEQKLKVEEAKELYALRLEAARLQAQKELQDLKNQMALAEKQYAIDTYNKINTAYINYYSAIYNLNDLKGQLIDKKATIAKLEAGVISAEAVNKANILYKEQAIAENEAKLAVLKDDAYAGLDNSELKAKAEAKKKEVELAKVAFAKDPTCAALLATNEPLKKALEELEAWDELLGVVNFMGLYEDGEIHYTIEGEDDSRYVSYYTAVAYDVKTDNNPEYISFKRNARVDETVKLFFENMYADNVERAADALGTAADTKDKETAYGDLAKANDDLKVANEALKTANAMPETTDAEKAAKETAVRAAKIQISNAERLVAEAKDNLVPAQKAYDEAVADQKKYNDAVAAFDVAAYNKAVAALDAAVEAKEEAEKAWNDAKAVVTKLESESNALTFLANNSGADINQQIANLEKDIAEAKVKIEEYKLAHNDAERTLENAKAEIEYLEDKIEGQTRIVEAAKAALDAAIASSDEETPEE